MNALYEEDDEVIPDILPDYEFQKLLREMNPRDRDEAVKKRKELKKEAEKIRKENIKNNSKIFNTFNGVLDTALKGLGMYGTVISTFKNALAVAYLENKKDNPDFAGKVPAAFLNISPGASTKFNQIKRGSRSLDYNKDEIQDKGLLDPTNPGYRASADILAGITNIQLNRLMAKSTNIANAFNEEYSKLQRVASGLGWSEYSLGIEKPKWDEIPEEEMIDLIKFTQSELRILPPRFRKMYGTWRKEYFKKQAERIKQEKGTWNISLEGREGKNRQFIKDEKAKFNELKDKAGIITEETND